MIDTHAHLWWESYKDDLKEVVARAKASGVEKIIVPGTDLSSSMAAIELAEKYPGVIYPAAGIHPEEASKAEFGELQKLVAKHREEIVAIGEIGIDLYTEGMRESLDLQKELFRRQLLMALDFELPVIIHTRESFAETWEVLSGLPKMPVGQFHCFSVDSEAVEKVVAAGFHVSFCGNISWSKRVARLVPLVPSDRLLLETDSPFMAPSARNEPASLEVLIQKIAELRGVASEEVDKTTTSNASALYHL